MWKNEIDNRYIADTSIVVLQILPWCPANWVLFVQDNTLPVSAVVGGCLGENPSVKTYVISGSTDDMSGRCGHCNPDTKLGDMPYMKPELITNINIWVLYKNKKKGIDTSVKQCQTLHWCKVMSISSVKGKLDQWHPENHFEIVDWISQQTTHAFSFVFKISAKFVK